MATTVETLENQVSAPPESRRVGSQEPLILRLPNRSPLPKPSSRKRTAGPPVVIPERWFIWSLRLLCLVALCASGYLAWVAFNQSKVYGCSGGDLFDCDHVLNSKWAKVFGCPVSVPAIGMYAATLFTLCVGIVATPGSLSWSKRSKMTWGIITVASLSAGLAALWFIGLQTLAIGHLCQYCLIAHGCGLCIAVGILWKRPLGLRTTAKLSLLSLTGVLTLIGAQLMAEEPVTYKIETFGPDVSTAPPVSAVENGNPAARDAEVFSPPGADGAAGDAEVFAPPGLEDDVFAPPGMDDDVFAPPVLEDDVFAPPGIDEEDPTTEIPAPIQEDDQSRVDPESRPTEHEIFGRPGAGAIERVTENDIFGPTVYEYRLRGRDIVTVPCQVLSSQTQSQPAGGTVQQDTASGQSASQAGKTNSNDTNSSTNDSTTANDTTSAAKPKPAPRRIVSVSGGRTRLDVRHWPLLGKPTAKFIFVEMFDYTCPHCRATHKTVHTAMEQYNGELAVISLPVPLNSACNSSVRQNHPAHADACELARIAVAAWRVSPSNFTQFHCWLFESDRARTPDEARAYAANLVGAEKLNAELKKPYASQYIAKHVQLYQRAGAGAVPKLMFPRSTIVGQVTSLSVLTGMIEKEFGAR